MGFINIGALAFHGESVFYTPDALMPYNNQELNVNPGTRKWSKDWDLWSVGMMTLEVLIGSELVLTLKTIEDVEGLLSDIRAFVPEPTWLLVHQMLLQVQDKMAVQSAKETCFASVYLVEKTVNDIEKAKKGNKILKARIDAFNAYVTSHEDELK